MIRTLVLISAILLGLMSLPTEAWGQSTPVLRFGAMAWGRYPHVQNTWDQVQSVVDNPTDTTVDVIVSVNFDAEPNLQYRSKVWIPPRARRRVVQPFRAVSTTEREPYRTVQATTMVLSETGGAERMFGRETTLLLSRMTKTMIGVIGDFPDLDDPVLDMVRMQEQLPKTETGHEGKKVVLDRLVQQIRTASAPLFADGWDGFDCVVISQDQPKLNPAQIESLRRWLIGGGRVWIMMEQVDPAFGARLLGRDFTCTVVERVSLNHITFIDRRGGVEQIEREQPVPMARLIAPGFDVLQTVDGWPAMLMRHVGRGRVLVTTVGPKAWMDEYHLSNRSIGAVPYLFINDFKEPPLRDADLVDYAHSQIGYRVMGRRPVAIALIGFLVLLLISGLVMARFNRLEWHAAVGVVLSLLTAGALLGFGAAHHGRIPSTVTFGQWMQIDPNQGYGALEGVTTVYAGRSLQSPLGTSRGGLLVPRQMSTEPEDRRMLWTDLREWTWRMPTNRPGTMRDMTMRRTAPLDKPVSVKLAFKEDQVTGEIETGPFKDWTDPILIVRRQHAVPRMVGDSRFVLDRTQRQVRDRFFIGASLTHDQIRRQALFERLAYRPLGRFTDQYPLVPTMIAWARPDGAELGFRFGDDIEVRDPVMLALPIEYVPSEPGTRVTVPSALIPRFRETGPANLYSASPYNLLRDEWDHTKMHDMTFMMRFELPRAVAPMRLEKAPLDVGISAPKRKVQLLDPLSENAIVLDEVFDVQGHAVFDLAKWPIFHPGPDGLVRVRIRIGPEPPADPTITDPEELAKQKKFFWHLYGITLEVTGEVLASEGG